MNTIRFRASRAAGYILLEAILALAVFSGIAAYQVRLQRDELVEGMAAAQGQQMRRIANAANLYAVDNFPRILNNTPIPIGVNICPAGLGGGVNVVNTRSPTTAELACLGFLPAGFTNAAMFGGGYQIQLNPTPGCVMPACNVEGYLITTAPVLSDSIVSAKVIGRALLEIGADGGASGLGGPPNAVVSLGSGVPIATPGFAVQPGMLAVNLGSTVTQFDEYLRRDGTRPMTGNLNMGGNDINNASQVNTNNLAVNGQVVTDLNMLNSITGIRQNINDANEVKAVTLSALGQVNVGFVTNIGAPCSPNGALGRLVDGSLLFCKSGSWTLTSTLSSGLEFDLNGNSEVECGSYSPARTCPDGSYMVSYRAWVTGGDISNCSVRCRWSN